MTTKDVQTIEKKRELLKTVILMPLTDALQRHNINEDTVTGVFSEILFDKDAKSADRLRAVELFYRLLGIVNLDRKLDVTVTHDIREALERLDNKRLQRERDSDLIDVTPKTI